MATPVFFIHDGAIDELICIPFLASMSNISLNGIWITPSDCLGVPTATVCSQLLNFINNSSVELYLSDTGSQRPFPWTYRQYALMVNLFPLLNAPGAAVVKNPTQVKTAYKTERNPKILQTLLSSIKKGNDEQGEPTVFLITSPMTDFVYLLDSIPDLEKEIASIVWMGGSISAGGNIDTGIAIGANPNAEWNAYWDPYSVKQVLASGLQMDMFPLDVTNLFLLTTSVLKEYFLPLANTSEMMNLACQMYALVAFQAGFSFWDTAAAAYLGKPSLFSTSSEQININVDEYNFTNFGCITQGAGYSVNIASATSIPDFYTYLTGQLANIK